MPDPSERENSLLDASANDRLDSWKEIAGYLKRDVSTVQRWEKREALPVHRHVHNRQATVYAYRSEIEAWWNNGRSRLEQEEQKAGARAGRRWLLATSVGVAVLLLGALALWQRGLLGMLWSGRFGARDRPSITLRRQAEPEGQMSLGLPSPDGRWLPYSTGDTGDLALYDLAGGQSRRLTNKGTWQASSDFALSASMSPEAGQVAYSWYNQDGDFVDLRLVPLQGGAPRVLYRDREIDHMQLTDWSRDGSAFLALFSRKDGRRQLVLIRPREGAVDVLKTFDGPAPHGMSLSPDGRSAVYDLPRGSPRGDRDIFLIETHGGGETTLVDDPKNDLWPFWAPDGSRVIFASDRTGTLSLWSLRVEGGKPRPPAEPIYKDLGRAWPLGITRDGSYYYQLQTGMVNVHMATLDPDTGRPLGDPTSPAIELVGSNLSPDWSPDGRFLAYTSRRGHVENEKGSVSLVVRSVETGEERALASELTFFNQPRWSPDGRTIALKGSLPGVGWGFHEIDASTGQAIRTLLKGNFFQAAWSRDGKGLFYNTSEQIVKRDLETGREATLYRVTAPSAVRLMTLSPDGRRLAFTLSREDGKQNLSVMPSAGGPVREILGGQDEPFFSLCFTADGQALLFVQGTTGSSERRLFRIAVTAGKARRLALAAEGLRDLRAHPDGRRVAFTSGWPTLELWVMERFLPDRETGRVSQAAR